jgi:iron complex outermembrane receptor protein
VNLVVKRPDADLRSASLAWQQDGSVQAGVDLSQRFGASREFGARLNVSAAHLDPNVRDAKGHRQTASIATDWRISKDSLLEFEFEHSLQSQPSVPAFSTLGREVPDPHAIDPHVNLNDQPWSLPVVMQGNTMSARFTQRLDPRWTLRVQALQQKLVSNDHLAFAYGLYDPQTYECEPYCHSFSSDGHYSIWDFRSDDERRTTRDVDLSLSGDFATGFARHSLTFGALQSVFTGRFQDEAYNLVGVGSIDGATVVPSDPSLTSPSTNRTERSTELYLRDAIQLGDDWSAWLGLRHTALHRQSSETSTGTSDDDTDYRQSFTTPWIALSRQLGADDMVYASWGKGIESDVAPNVGAANAHGQALATTTSRQWELGWKHGRGVDHWGVDAFDTEQAFNDVVGDAYVHDGVTHSRGIEAEAQARLDALTLRASAMRQRVKREGALDPALNGLRPTNVPETAVKLLATYAVAQVPGLSVLGNVSYEGAREVFPENDVRIPAWTRYDLALRYAQTVAGTAMVWRAGVNNVFDRHAWRESPYQYDHAYLFPLEPRTFFASVEASF